MVSGEAILSAENSGKPSGGRGSVPNPAGEAHNAPQIPPAVPFPKNPVHTGFGLDFRPFGLAP